MKKKKIGTTCKEGWKDSERHNDQYEKNMKTNMNTNTNTNMNTMHTKELNSLYDITIKTEY